MFNSIVVGLLFATALLAEQVGPFTSTSPTGVAPNCNAPVLFQRFPGASFGKGAYLVAWADGERQPSQKSTDIYCARIDSATGQTLDPNGILVCNADYNQSHPVVAFDGANFLVVWEDLRSNRDYDIYAARVSESGQVLDPNGFAVSAIRDTNEIRPAVGFANGNYLVAWSDARRYPVYGIWGARITPAGSVLDASGFVIDAETQKNIDLKKPLNGRWNSFTKDYWWEKLVSYYSVNIASGDNFCYVSYVYFTGSGTGSVTKKSKLCKIDPLNGQFLISPKTNTRASYLWDASAVCVTPKGGALNLVLSQPGFGHGMQSFCQRFDTTLTMRDTIQMNGAYFVSPQPRIVFFNMDYGNVNDVRGENQMMDRFSCVYNGKNIVNAMQHFWYKTDKVLASGIVLCRSSLDNLPLLDSSLIRIEENVAAVGKSGVTVSWPYLTAGPNNSCLLVYEKCAGIDNRQIICRILREN